MKKSNDIRARMEDMARGDPRNQKPTHQHIQRGTFYTELDREDLFIEATNEPAVLYRAQNGTKWVRAVTEFDDPKRFRKLRVTK